MIGSIFDEIQRRTSEVFTGWFQPWIDLFLSPLWLWYSVGVGVFICVAVIAFFLPFKWVRAFLGGVLLLAGAFLAGGHTMWNQQKHLLEDERRRRKLAEEKAKVEAPRRDTGFRWPF